MRKLYSRLIGTISILGLSLFLVSGSVFASGEPVMDIPPETMGMLSHDLYAIHQMDNSLTKSKLFADMAVEFSRQELSDESHSLFNQSMLLTSHLIKRVDRAEGFRYIAEQYRKLGLVNEARNALSLSLYHAHQLWTSDKKAEVFMSVSEEFKRLNFVEEARSIAMQAKTISKRAN